MHVSLRTLIITTFLLIFGLGVVNGQEENTNIETVIYIHDSLDTVESRLFDTVREAVSDYNVRLYIVQHNLHPTQFGAEQWITVARRSSISWSLDASWSNLYLYEKPLIYSVYNLSEFDLQSPMQSLEINSNDRYDALVALLTGLVLYQSGYYDAAIAEFSVVRETMPEEAIRSEPENFARFLEFYIANSWLMSAEYDNAIESFETLLASDPNHIQSLYNLAWSHIQNNSTDDALNILENLDEAYAAFPENRLIASEFIDQLQRRSQLFALAFEYDRAIEDIDRAIDISNHFYENPEPYYGVVRVAELYTIRGEINFLIYEWDRVEDNFDMALEIDPTYAPAYFQRGVLFYTMARREEALADFETYLELDENGIYAEQAQSYIESIQIELDALGGE